MQGRLGSIAAILCPCVIACSRRDSVSEATARATAQAHCDRALEVVVVGPVNTNAEQQCAIGTSAVAFWTDSGARALRIDPNHEGVVRRVYFSEITLGASGPGASAETVTRDSFWTVQLELPSYARDFTVWISRSTGRYSLGTAHKFSPTFPRQPSGRGQ